MRKLWLILTVCSLAAFAVASDPQPRVIQPHDAPNLPSGPGRTELVNDCTACHTLRYITMQPRFPRKVWQAEVTKMVTAYKATFSPEDQAKIVDYLVANFGTPDPVHTQP